MLLNGYLMQRATLQRDYNEKSSEFVSLVPSTQISDLSEHLLSSKIHTFHEENTKKINIKQKELQDLQMNTKETTRIWKIARERIQKNMETGSLDWLLTSILKETPKLNSKETLRIWKIGRERIQKNMETG